LIYTVFLIFGKSTAKKSYKNHLEWSKNFFSVAVLYAVVTITHKNVPKFFFNLTTTNLPSFATNLDKVALSPNSLSCSVGDF